MFSLSVTIINFIGFAFVAVAYIAVTMKAAKSMNQRSRGKDKKNGISWIDIRNHLHKILTCSD